MDRPPPTHQGHHQVGHTLRQAYTLMRDRFGHQHWWPGETPFEVAVGAILTQNTNWSNVERAISNLKQARVLHPDRLYNLPVDRLAELLRPAGYYNVKARRLRAFLKRLVEQHEGHLQQLLSGPTPSIRKRLLGIVGIGPETADSILLYASKHRSFVIDAYTQRIFGRHQWCRAEATYDDLKGLCESSLSTNSSQTQLDLWRDYHAQLVMVGKHYCRPRSPRCGECPLQRLLPDPANPPLK